MKLPKHLQRQLRLPQIAASALLTGMYLTFVCARGRSLDFGNHWDEPLQLELIGHGRMSFWGIPYADGFYNYPNFTFLVAFLGRSAAHIVGHNEDHGVLLASRFISLMVAATAVPAAGLLAYRLLKGRTALARLTASAAGSLYFVLSPQYAYHSRWLAPDAMLTAVCMWWCLAAHHAIVNRTKTSNIVLSLIGGLAVSIKYQGVVLLVTALGITWIASTQHRMRTAVSNFSLSGLFFLALNPGLLLQTKQFMSDLYFEWRHYATGHGTWIGSTTPYDVVSNGDYMNRLFRFLLHDWLIGTWSIGIFLILMVLVGLIRRTDINLKFAFISPLALLVVLFADNKVAIARNWMLATPFLLGLALMGAVAPLRTLHRLFSVLVVGCICAFAYMGIRSSLAIERPSLRVPASWSRDIAWISNSVATTEEPRYRKTDGYVVFATNDLRKGESAMLTTWKATSSFGVQYQGSEDVDTRWYPGLLDNDRAARMKLSTACKIGLTSVLGVNYLCHDQDLSVP